MKFKIDENLAFACAGILRAAGHDAMTVHEQTMSGTSDDVLALVCHEEDRVLITADLDFSDMRAYPVQGTPGHIVLRLKDQTATCQVKVMRRVLSLLETHPIKDRLWIVDDRKVRIRSLMP